MVDPKGRDKEARAHAVTDLFADRMIYAPDREWAQMVIDQAAQFPKAAHDDLVDTTLYALEHLRSIGFAIRADDFERELNEPPPKPLPTLYEV
jgi:phage terminase large subunit-like protein